MPRYAIIRVDLDSIKGDVPEVLVFAKASVGKPVTVESKKYKVDLNKVVNCEQLPTDLANGQLLGLVYWVPGNSGCVYWIGGQPVKVC